MKTTFGFLVALVLGACLQASAFAADYVSTCASFPAPLTGGYCIHKPTGPQSRDYVYYLHGRGGNEHYWQDPWYYTHQIQTEWKNHHARMPTVISISFGPTWLLAEKNASPYSGLFEILTQQVIPSIEQSLGRLRGRRIIFGESMGGLNSIQLALKTRLFNKAAILCAPMSEVSPFAPMDQVVAHLEKSSAYQYYKESEPDKVLNTAKDAIALVNAFYPTEADYTTSNPLNLAVNSRSRTKLYVTAGFYDAYALFEGNEKFVEDLRRRYHQVEWHPMWGGHCVADIPSLARFLVH